MRAVVYLYNKETNEEATGFLIPGALIMTNRHVISDEKEATLFEATFDFDEFKPNKLGKSARPTSSTHPVYRLDPTRFFWSPEKEMKLDVTIVSLGRLSTTSSSFLVLLLVLLLVLIIVIVVTI